MKFFLPLFLPFALFASGEMMSVQDSLYFSNADKQPFAQKQQQKVRMHKLCKIDEKRVKSIVSTSTQEDSKYLKLSTHGKYLVYRASTQHYRLLINALDGTVMEKVSK